jgi:hypothetical protein
MSGVLENQPEGTAHIYPDLVAETEIEPGVYVRTLALPKPNKYGNHYETVGVAGNKMKGLWYHQSREAAIAAHPTACRYILQQRRARSRASS